MTAYLILLLLAALCGTWAFRRVLVADRARWERSEENRRLYEAVSGKVLVRNLGGIIPEGTVLFMAPDLLQPYGILHGILHEPVFTSEPDLVNNRWMRAEWSFAPVTRPESMFKITGV